MKERTKQRLEQMYKIYMSGNNGGETFEVFSYLTKLDKVIYDFIKELPDEMWEEFMSVYYPQKEDVVCVQFDWNCLPKWCNKYIRMDKHGDWYCYSEEPEISIVIPSNFAPKNYTGKWEDSLKANPGNEANLNADKY